MNYVKTAALLAALTALFLWIGHALGGPVGLGVALAFACIVNFLAYWHSDRIVLRMSHAQEVSPAEEPELWSAARALADRAGIPVPRLYIIPGDAPNAFATGRSPDKASVAVTRGLLQEMSHEELTGVLGHELSHVANRDTLIMTIAGTLAGALSMLADLAFWGMLLGGGSDDDEAGNPLAGLLGIILAPFAAMLIQLAISRSREYHADEAGARLTGNPHGLANALRKMEEWKAHAAPPRTTPALAHLYIVNPFTASGLLALFGTHPPIAARIARLEAMAERTAAAR